MDSAELRGNSVPLPVVEALLTGRGVLDSTGGNARDGSVIRGTGTTTINLPPGEEDDVGSRTRVVNMNASDDFAVNYDGTNEVTIGAGKFADFIRFPGGWRRAA